MELSKINWGSDSAETDPNLLHYFVLPTHFDRLKNFQKSFVVGRKGAGKSAVRRKLVSLLEEPNEYIVVEALPSQTVFRSVKNDAEIRANFGEEVFFQYAWLNYLMQKAFAKIGSLQEGKLAHRSFAEARNFARSRGTANPDFIESVKSLVNSIKLKAGNLAELGIELDNVLRRAGEIDAFEYHLLELAKEGVKICFLIDDLDVGWDNSSLSNRVLHGLLLAAHYLKSVHSNFFVFIFVRDDMYRLLLLGTQHSDKFRDNVPLKWDPASLQSVLEERIRFNYEREGEATEGVLFHKVFPRQVGPQNTINWIAERTLGRPRELIQLAKLYTENLVVNEPDSEALKAVEETYSKMKIEDLCAEFTNQYPGLKSVFDFWRVKFNRTKYHLKAEDLDNHLFTILSELQLKEPWFQKLVNDADLLEFKKILFEIGFIGDFILGGQGGSKTIYSDEVHTPIFQEVQVHPCFRKAIGTVERIRT